MKRRILFNVRSLAVLAALFWLSLSPQRLSAQSELVYQGKTLREWLSLYPHFTIGRTQEVNEAVRHIGTNAIPTLLEMLQETDSPLKLKWFALLQKQHFIKSPQPPEPALWRNRQAALAFEVLGASASNAAPALAKIYLSKVSTDSQRWTVWALYGIGPSAGPAATPALLDALTNSDKDVHWRAIFAIGRIHSQPEVFMPALINDLTNSDSYIRFLAAQLLAEYGQAKTAVPTIVSSLNDFNPDIRDLALNDIVALLNDPNPDIRDPAIDAFNSIDPVAGLSAFIYALEVSSIEVRFHAANVLAKCGPAAKPAVSVLVDLAKNDPELGIRAYAAAALKRSDPEAAAKAGIK